MVKALSNVEKSFDNIKKVTKEITVWKPGWVANKLYHPQGIAVSGDKIYVSHNGKSEGYIYVFKEGEPDEVVKERKILGGDEYNHPGTIQIANHLLIATLQKQSGGAYNGTQVILLDLNEKKEDEKEGEKTPVHIILRDDSMNGKGVASIVCVEDSNNGQNQKYIAISDKNVYEIKISGNEISYFVPGKKMGKSGYTSTLSWSDDNRDNGVDIQNVNLLVDKNGTVYAIKAGVRKNNAHNVLRLYRMEPQEKDSSGRILSAEMQYIKEKLVVLGNSWLTFSAGVGIDIQGESIIVYTTSKPASSSRRLSIGMSLA